MRDWLYPKRLEIHQSFDSILNEKKRFVTQGLKVCLLLFSEYKAANQKDYDLSINLQFSFVNNVLSLPTINKYLLPMITPKSNLNVDFKLLFQSYYFASCSDS